MFESELKSKVTFTAKMLIKAGLIEGFGHVSLRVKKGFLITSTRPLAKSTSKNVIFYNISDPPKKTNILSTFLLHCFSDFLTSEN